MKTVLIALKSLLKGSQALPETLDQTFSQIASEPFGGTDLKPESSGNT